MLESQETRREDVDSQEIVLGDAVPCNGRDYSADRRAHMRELTLARQAAERRHLRPASDGRLDRPAQLAAARVRAQELHEELARIDAAHQTWLRARGEDVPALPSRHRKSPGTEQS